MREPFEEFLQELSEVLGIELWVDRKGACSLRIHGHLHVQMQLGPEREELWMVAELGELPPGKFREEVLKGALKANDAFDGESLMLSYVPVGNRLFLSSHCLLQELKGQAGAALLSMLVSSAEQWKQALAMGRSAP